MTQIAYLDQSCENLLLEVSCEPGPSGRFVVLREERLSAGTLGVHARVIGASHCIDYRLGEAFWQETVRCVERGEPDFHPDVARKVSRLREPICLRAGRAHYRFASHVLDSTEAQEELACMERQTRGVGRDRFLALSYTFPPAEGSSCGGKTIVLAEAVAEGAPCIQVRTAHAYPNEERVVLTATTVELIQ